MRLVIALAAPMLLVAFARNAAAPPPAATHSPLAVAFSSDGRLLAVADFTGNNVAMVDPVTGRVARRVRVRAPRAVCWLAGRLYVARFLDDDIVEISPGSDAPGRALPSGAYPVAIAGIPRSSRLLAASMGDRNVVVLDVRNGRAVARLPCAGEPSGLAVTPDGRIAVVSHLLPTGDATSQDNACTLAVFDLANAQRIVVIKLPAGSANVRGVAITPDGRWACLVHAVGRYNLPTTQLDRGWVNTNAMSVVDLRARKHYATVLLDQPQEGAADPWDIVIAKDGKTAWITLSGVHEIARLDLDRLLTWIGGGLPDNHPLNRPSPEWAITTRNIWQEIKTNPAKRADLVNDLSALYVGELIQRVRLPGLGPRGLAMLPNGQRLAVAQYFTGDVALVDVTARVRSTVSLGASPSPGAERRGERYFHDGTLAFQHWLSCATCHPDGRADGLNWDLLNDGIGNPKNTRSLLLAHQRSPMMAHGVRADLRVAATAGYRYILFRTPQAGEVEDTMAYVRSLRPLPSPRRKGPGRALLTERALQGKTLFESKRTRCTSCHRGPYLTDGKLYDVGTRGPYDTANRFVTPPLIELWRTGPYLHDGRAVTMQDVLTKYNRRDRHGVTSNLTRSQVDALTEYLLSL